MNWSRSATTAGKDSTPYELTGFPVRCPLNYFLYSYVEVDAKPYSALESRLACRGALSRAAQAKLTLGMTRRFLVCAVAQVVRPGIFPNSSEDALLVLPLNTDAVNRNITVS